MPDDAAHRPEAGAPSSEATIEDYLTEDRVFPPSEEFRRQALVSDPAV